MIRGYGDTVIRGEENYGFCARTASGSVSLWPMLAGSTLIYRKLSSPPQALRLRARLDTNGEKKNRSRIYDLGVVPTRGNNKIV